MSTTVLSKSTLRVDPSNPLGIRDLDSLEFTTHDLEGPSSQLFHKFGFERSQISNAKNSLLYSQGQVRFILTKACEENKLAHQYFLKHGEGVCTLSFWVENIDQALEYASSKGAKITEDIKIKSGESGDLKTGSIKGLGDIRFEFIERPSEVFRYDFRPYGNDPQAKILPVRFARVDHLTNNVEKGQMDYWANFYKEVFGMIEIRYFDIKGSKTGLHSRAMGLANKKVIIPINEPDSAGSRSQIQEFLDLHHGPGVQHIAFMIPDIISVVAELKKRGIRFLDIPHTYYEGISKRGIQVTEDLKVLEEKQILVDGKDNRYLLQNFTDTYIGPLFFEMIQRKGDQGFGEGNFTALFESIERDQIKRGYLK